MKSQDPEQRELEQLAEQLRAAVGTLEEIRTAYLERRIVQSFDAGRAQGRDEAVIVPTPQRLITTRDVAERLALKPPAALRWLRQQNIAPAQILGLRRWEESVVETAITGAVNQVVTPEVIAPRSGPRRPARPAAPRASWLPVDYDLLRGTSAEPLPLP